MSETDDWYAGMAMAAFTLSLQAVAMMIEARLLPRPEVLDVIDRSLLDFEERVPPGAHRQAILAARDHLERALASLRLVDDG